MPAPIVLRNLVPPPKRVDNPQAGMPKIATRSDMRDGTRSGGLGPTPAPTEALFHDSFDGHADWVAPEPVTATMFSWKGDQLPAGWSALYNSGDNYQAHPNLEIGPSLLDEPGKVLRVWREWHPSSTFGSNATLGKLFDNDYDEMYVEFEIAFQEGWTTNVQGDVDASKVFRVFSSDRDTTNFWQAFSGGHQGPLFIWDVSQSAGYGCRNGIFFRGGPHGQNYSMHGGNQVLDIGRDTQPGSLGDISMNWTSDMAGALTGGLSPQIPDKLNGGYLPSTGNVTHEQVFGPAGTFTKLGFYVKMNSAPGVQDGQFKQFLDDQLVVDSNRILWIPSGVAQMPGWNAFALGGNDSFSGNEWSDNDQREEFYEIRSVTVYPQLPEVLA